MPITITESLPLGRFIYEPDWTPIRGTYIYPLRIFASERSSDPNDYLEVIKVINVAGTDIAITRGGGFFVRDQSQPGESVDSSPIANAMNLLQCELALKGLVSQTITDIDIQCGKLIGRHASLTGGWGNYADRTFGPFFLLASGARNVGAAYGVDSDHWPVNAYWTTHPPDTITSLQNVATAMLLRDLSPTIPSLVVTAVYHTSRHNLAEMLISSWIVAEQILSSLWDKYVEPMPGPRRDRLRDARSYSASVRAEVLFTTGLLDPNAYDVFQRARKVRNDLAHRSAISEEGAEVCLQAMRAMLGIYGVSTESFQGYVHMSGRNAPPRNVLPPAFRFE